MNEIANISTEIESLPVFAFEVAGNSIFRWLLAIVIFIVAYFIARIVCTVLIKVLTRTARKSKNRFDDIFVPILESINRAALLLIALCIAAQSLELPSKLANTFDGLLIAALLFQAGLSGTRFMEFLLDRVMPRDEEDPAKSSATGLLMFVGKTLLWSLVVIVFLDNLDVDITALIAGLGVGGIAVALAVQNVLGDLLSSLSIILDKPFRVGDFIVVGEMVGSVEKIGIKSTRIKSLSGEQLIVSNSDLLSSRIRNYKRLYERRVVFGIGVTYQTPPATLKTIPPKVKEIVESLDDVRFDRAHFKEFGDSALQFEIVYYVLSPDFALYMDRQEAINLALLEFCNESGIEFAYPTQTLFIEGLDLGQNPVNVKDTAKQQQRLG